LHRTCRSNVCHLNAAGQGGGPQARPVWQRALEQALQGLSPRARRAAGAQGLMGRAQGAGVQHTHQSALEGT
jgi:hypothetical protein